MCVQRTMHESSFSFVAEVSKGKQQQQQQQKRHTSNNVKNDRFIEKFHIAHYAMSVCVCATRCTNKCCTYDRFAFCVFITMLYVYL